jgi:cytidine deaminase
MVLNDEMRGQLIKAALDARSWAYAPYSKYKVGAALLTTSGKIYGGLNIENAAYSPTVCAERVAVFKAVSEGEREFIAIAVVTTNARSPCGVCRQVLAEFGLQTTVLFVNTEGDIVRETTVAELLPHAFQAEDLVIDRDTGEL